MVYLQNVPALLKRYDLSLGCGSRKIDNNRFSIAVVNMFYVDGFF